MNPILFSILLILGIHLTIVAIYIIICLPLVYFFLGLVGKKIIKKNTKTERIFLKFYNVGLRIHNSNKIEDKNE